MNVMITGHRPERLKGRENEVKERQRKRNHE